MTSGFAGQWLGTSEGDPNALVVLDLDDEGPIAKGRAYLYPHDGNTPASAAYLELPNKLPGISKLAPALHFMPKSGFVPSMEQLTTQFPEVAFPQEVGVEIKPLNAHQLEAEWSTAVGTFGKAILSREPRKGMSDLPGELSVTDWRSFQAQVTEKFSTGCVFRGQSLAWPITSTFHRTRRRDLTRYLKEDIPQLHRALSSTTKHIFDLDRPQQLGSFMNLVQHHGFPTPLLDWSYSPYVAAYFAFEKARTTSGEFGTSEKMVRVYALDKVAYERDFEQLQSLTYCEPHFSFLEALAIENDRAVPQQGLLTLTNIERVEDFIRKKEDLNDTRYLYAFDIPYAERNRALKELRLMGITRATLFPGIDSICSELTSRLFG